MTKRTSFSDVIGQISTIGIDTVVLTVFGLQYISLVVVGCAHPVGQGTKGSRPVGSVRVEHHKKQEKEKEKNTTKNTHGSECMKKRRGLVEDILPIRSLKLSDYEPVCVVVSLKI